MNAAEVIELIKKLPPEERRKLRDYFDQKEASENTGVRRIDLEKAKVIGEGVFDRHPDLFRKLAE